jgi:hypothetical protein
MNKEQLKKVLKPMIKECIKEVIFEDGVLSSIISEVVKGTSTNVVVETKQPPQSMRGNDEIKKKIAESRKQLADAIGNDSYNGVNLFEGTQPATKSDPHSPMAGTEPGDKGVDITAIPGARNWNKLI